MGWSLNNFGSEKTLIPPSCFLSGYVTYLPLWTADFFCEKWYGKLLAIKLRRDSVLYTFLWSFTPNWFIAVPHTVPSMPLHTLIQIFRVVLPCPYSVSFFRTLSVCHASLCGPSFLANISLSLLVSACGVLYCTMLMRHRVWWRTHCRAWTCAVKCRLIDMHILIVKPVLNNH